MIGKRIKAAREGKGLKALYVAQRIGKSSSWLSKVENGVQMCPADMLLPLANVIGVDVEVFLFEEEILVSRISHDEEAATSA